jgi:tRNA threonylcarbamoyladenosine biosynthesis protein TsaB
VRIVAIETSGRAGSVALLDGDLVIRESSLSTDKRSARTLAPAIRDILQSAGWQAADVRLIAVAVGPGSFTSLRIGVTTAKTFAYAVQAEVVGVNTLEVIAAQAPTDVNRLSVILDAQRQQVFAGEFSRGADALFDWYGSTTVVENDMWIAGLRPSVAVSGPGLEKLATRLPLHVRAVASALWSPRASNVGQLGWRRYQSGQRDDLWHLVPQYFRRSAAEEKLERTTNQLPDDRGSRGKSSRDEGAPRT